MRRPFVAGNWKMNLDLAAARTLVSAIRAELKTANDIDLAVCPPFPYLLPMSKALDASGIRLGAQNVHPEPGGAFTGEVSPLMLADCGVRYVIIGHSERRHTIGHHEDDLMANQKLRATRAAALTPILCIGETLDQRKAGRTLDVLTYQIVAGLVGVNATMANSLVIAYEPVWAIGTGLNATPEQAQEAHAHIRAELRRLFGPPADAIQILYGGSVKPENAGAIMAQPDVDGGLIGGASLKAESFVGIVRATLAAKRWAV
ncbi:MAG: triose-phosphate isomerase [Phycisphaerae bacterium]